MPTWEHALPEKTNPSRNPLHNPALLQGIFYLAAGTWPLVDMGSFLDVTGPKTDLWLVSTVGLLLAVVGIVLFCAGIRKKRNLEVFLLGLGSAASLASIEISHVYLKVISPIYLLDAFIEVVLVVCWISGPAFRRLPGDLS